MALTINFIIGTSVILALICWGLTFYYFRQVQKFMATIWLIAGFAAAGLAGFFIWAAIPLWTSI
ncbi:hypothetical protein RA086_13145 [Lactiplantibacillus sp. WILCCON 0030]|uniref:Uncharacterized protein n=1 Tax=Lactiplantibacillus brownii TaxID=3069269 RepID=A0ABU1AC83_9LACO|nr:hypothetical protein [Lactiplantibacillus brownii]MDQ7938554.1 hypothetical protein [Lactiplantibacillus brownii]